MPTPTGLHTWNGWGAMDADIEPRWGSDLFRPVTQGGASLALGSAVQPLRGKEDLVGLRRSFASPQPGISCVSWDSCDYTGPPPCDNPSPEGECFEEIPFASPAKQAQDQEDDESVSAGEANSNEPEE